MRRDWRHVTKRADGRVRLHLHTSQVLWDEGYRHYDVAHNLSRWQAFKLAARLFWLAGK